jgi:hypothetical protein
MRSKDKVKARGGDAGGALSSVIAPFSLFNQPEPVENSSGSLTTVMVCAGD